jgi:hypothetical protein
VKETLDEPLKVLFGENVPSWVCLTLKNVPERNEAFERKRLAKEKRREEKEKEP